MAIKSSKPNPFIAWCLGIIVPAWIRLIRMTTRWEVIGQENFERARASEEGMIVVFWHSRILMMVDQRRLFPNRFWFMISEHRDGELIARAVKGFDISFARGSARNPRKKAKNKSGSNALRTLLKALRRGEGVGLTPDGPRGPREKCHAGIVQLAKLSGVPVYPAAFAVQRAHFFSTWDRFHFPFPFSKGCYVYGDPIIVEGDEEEARQKIEDALQKVTREADRRMGHLATDAKMTAQAADDRKTVSSS
ncbi:MAG: lysophospholipid acyltransferase family protein [Aquisalinus sp.]|nr:lysophospholipid acyltransferase family protein [Aquisalinus sp.]